MKKIIEYKREWESLFLTSEKPYVIPMEPYVVMHFLEDIGATEPWKAEDQNKIEKAVKELSEQEQKEFMRLFEEVRGMTEKPH